MLFDRSLVLSEHEEIAFVVSDGRNVALTIDGRELGELVLRRSGAVSCRRGAAAARERARRATSTRS